MLIVHYLRSPHGSLSSKTVSTLAQKNMRTSLRVGARGRKPQRICQKVVVPPHAIAAARARPESGLGTNSLADQAEATAPRQAGGYGMGTPQTIPIVQPVS